MECTACPGDVLFVPHGWWHMVLNIGDDGDVTGGADDRNVAVALTRNYVSSSNLSDVLRFLDTRVSQISGCRDREEAVKPEELGREFRKALLSVEEVVEEGCRNGEEKKCDESQVDDHKRGKWGDLLAKAEERAKKGWGCDAWVDLPPTCPNSNSCNESNGESNTEKQTTVGSSVLARAKQHDGGDDVVTSTSGGFSFSFL